MEFILLEILQPPKESGEKVVDGEGKAGDVDESETNEAEHQNLVFSMHVVFYRNTTDLTITFTICFSLFVTTAKLVWRQLLTDSHSFPERHSPKIETCLFEQMRSPTGSALRIQLTVPYWARWCCVSTFVLVADNELAETFLKFQM